MYIKMNSYYNFRWYGKGPVMTCVVSIMALTIPGATGYQAPACFSPLKLKGPEIHGFWKSFGKSP